MEKKETKSKSVLISWIPEKCANKGKVLELKDRDSGKWSNGWIVKNVSRCYRDKAEVVTRSHDYKNQRNASDI